MKYLIAYTTNAGSTEDVARAIADELSKDGSQVDVQRLEQVRDLETYQAVIVGAPMILGWHRAAVNFIGAHQQALSRVPVAYFITAMSLTRAGQEALGGVPVYVDAGLAKPPHHAGSLSLKERYTSLANYARQPLKAGPMVKPVSIGIFGGKLEMYRLKLLQALFVLLILRAQMGSLQNLSSVREWAAQLRIAFTSQSA